jgi:adenine-specific DNA-methyltransferase
MTKKQKLELTWVGKDNRPRLEPRILIEDPAKSYHAAARVTDADIFDNVLIHGDNLLALKALESDYAGKVKCVFIDPPYNTGSAFAQYDDGLEHSIWLGLMRDRLEIIRRLLSDDGSLWITIDDNEAHYLKVLCDEVFGRTNFVANVVWKKKYTVSNDAKWFSDNHDHILIFAANKEGWRPNKLPRSDEMNARYANPDHHPKGPWKATPLHAKSGSEKAQKFTFTFKNGYVWSAPPGTFPRFSEDTLRRYDDGNEIWFGRDGTAQPSRKTFLSELTNDGTPPLTVWLNDEVGHNHEAKTEAKEFNSTDVFSTPKPERLLNRILHIATNPGDLVFDSFAGSGTTGAVAHKMGRRWIMVELGDHCTTHIVPRLRKVIDGSDQGGISKAVDWKGGGGFRYYGLAPSLLEKDKWGREVISQEYDAAMLAQALCKLEGFTYAPSDSVYWQQGHSSESDFLYVTTQTLGPEELAALSEEVGEGRSLLILCAAFRGNADLWPNLTLRKIPNHIRSKCEWGHDDYSLSVANLPMAEKAPPPPPPAQSGLFDGEDEA